MKHKVLTFIILCGLFASGFIVWQHNQAAAPSEPTFTPHSQQTGDAFDKARYSKTDPASIWVVVNKQHPLLPKDYAPRDLVMPAVTQRVPGHESMQLRQEAATALENMFNAAKKQGVNLMLASGYRTYNYQVNLYNGYVRSQGQAAADTQSARPGYSEHQTGFAADVEPASKQCELQACFGDTPEGKWVAANTHTYGFILRYQPGDEDITGYEPEPWHLRYVGEDLASELRRANITTLERFFDISGGKVYVE